jgi:hypothetical protein
LIEPKNDDGSRATVKGPLEIITYEIDEYDRVRMQLLIENEIFYRNFKETLAELETNSKYQPRKR